MKSRAFALGAAASGRNRLLGLFAILFVVAQFIAAAHAAPGPGDLFDHTPTSCAACLAGSASDDPSLLTVSIARPDLTVAPTSILAIAERIFSTPVAAAPARAPPAC